MTRDAAVTSPGTGPSGAPPAEPGDPGRPRMRYTVDGWDPAYGASLELEEYLQESSADVAVDLELPASEWHPIDVRTDIAAPEAMLFVDGVRRIEARVWIDSPGNAGEAASGPATDATAALCASYAAGVVCCCGPAGAPGDSRTAARTVFHRTARQRHQHQGRQATRPIMSQAARPACR